MFARLATFASTPHVLPDDARRAESLRALVRAQPGFRAGYHLRQPTTGRMISLTIWESEQAMNAAGRTVASRPKEDQRGITPDSIETWQVEEF